VSEDVERAEEDHKVHDHVPALRGEHEPGVVVDAPRSGNARCPLGVEGDATKHAEDHEYQVPRAQDGY
jgi:hypothetical protein